MQHLLTSTDHFEEAYTNSGISYGLANTIEELEQAFELVWNGYTKVGLHPADGTGKRITKYHLLPDTKVFIAKSWKKTIKNGKILRKPHVIGTLTVVHDGCLGLPAEEVCKNGIVQLRKNGEKTAEFIGLACDQEGNDKRVSLKLFRLAYEYCFKRGLTGIIASLTERHIGYYRRFLGFSPLGELSSYSLGNGTPVQAHYVHIENGRELFEKRTNILFNEKEWKHFWHTSASEILRQSAKVLPWSQEQMKHFISLCPALLEQIDIHAANALSAEYKRYDIELGLIP